MLHFISLTTATPGAAGDGWIQPEQEEIEEVMERYHELQQEFVEQQVGLAPHLVPANQVSRLHRIPFCHVATLH